MKSLTDACEIHWVPMSYNGYHPEEHPICLAHDYSFVEDWASGKCDAALDAAKTTSNYASVEPKQSKRCDHGEIIPHTYYAGAHIEKNIRYCDGPFYR